ncbi:MAG TPA: TonB-dependent receptor [Rhizomicrobium sp.]|nr:TonB-dependent receptor [Rhizomicrobium sp.]
MILVSAPARADTERQFEIALPAVPLSDALKQIAQQTGEDILFTADSVVGIRTAPLRGRMSARIAVQRLLSGTGLEVLPGGSNSLVVREAHAAIVSPSQLPPSTSPVPPAAEPVAQPVESVTITGTSFRGVSPVGGNLTSVDRGVIEKTAAINSQQMLKTVTGVTGFGMSGVTMNAGNSYYAPTIHSLGASSSNSTLVLIDGHRIPLGGISLALPDPSIVPPIAVERVEVLAEGASSVYGSDAVAGVINFITRKNYDGVQMTAQAGTGDDFGTLSTGMLGGTSWQGGSMMAALGYAHTRALRYNYISRPYLRPDKRPYGGTNFQTFNCSPAAIQPSGFSTIYPSLTAAAPIANSTTNAPCNSQQYGSVYGSETRYNMLFRAEQDIGDRVTVSSNFVYSDRRTFTPQSRGTIQATVFRTGAQANPFYVNPPGVTPGARAGDSQTIRWDADELLGPGAYINNTAPVWYGTLDTEWRINDNWRATAFLMEGEDRTASTTVGTLCQSCATLALNGTTNTSGSLTAVVPGTTLTPTQLPLTADNALDVWNPVGNNRTSAAVLKVLTDSRSYINQVSDIQQIRVGVDGTLFKLPAGDLRLAFGGESVIYVLNTDVVNPINSGPASLGSSYRYFPLKRHVESGYFEVLAPMISPEMNAFLYRLDLSASGRYDHYSGFGGAFNPKFAADVEFMNGLKLRANWSTSFVAPSMRAMGDSLYGTYSNSTARSISTVTQVPISRFPAITQIPGIPCTAGYCTIGNNIQGIVVDTGNPNLNPEKGQTWSVGLDVSPHFLEGFTGSITLFNNLLRGGITSPCAPGCILNNGALNYQFSVYPNGATPAEISAKVNDVPIVSVFPQTTYYIFRRAQTNALDLDVSGLDMSASYHFDTGWGRFNFGGSVTQFLRFVESYGGSAKYSIVNTVGINSTFPSIARQARLAAGWDREDYSLELYVNNVGGYRNWGSGTVNPLVLDTNGNVSSGGDYVRSWTTVDLHASWDFSHGGLLAKSQVYIDVNNVFNEAPPFFNNANGYDPYGANPLGRVMSLGLRVRY